MAKANPDTTAPHRTKSSKQTRRTDNPGAAASAIPARSIAVLGMHRSGTSAVTGALRLCGAWIGDEEALTGSNAENPKGFWERRDVRDICDALLHAAGADWWRIAGFETAAVPHASVSDQSRNFRAVVEDLNKHGTWAVKEPRLSLLFPLLQSLMPSPVCLLPYRHPLEVAQSLRWRNGFGIAEGLALWEAYTRSALCNSRGLPRFLVSYEKLVSDPHGELKRVCDKLREFDVPGISMPATVEIDGFVTPSLYRQRVEGEWAMEFLLPSQRQLWAQLESGEALQLNYAEAIAPVTRQHLRDLESRVFADKLKAIADKAQTEAKALREKLNSATSHANDLEKAVAELTHSFKAEKTRADDLSKTVVELTHSREAAKTRADELANTVAELTHSLEAEQKRADEQAREMKVLSNARDGLQERADKLAGELVQLEDERTRLNEKLEWRLKSLNRMRDKFNARAKKAETLEKELAQVRKTNEKLKGSLSWRLTTPVRIIGKLVGRGGSSSSSAKAKLNTTQPLLPAKAIQSASSVPKPATSVSKQKSAIVLSPEQMRKERNNAIAKAREAGKRGDWKSAASIWERVLHNYTDKEDVAALARFNLSIARRISDIDGVKARIANYQRARSESDGGPKVAVFTAISGAYDSLKLPDYLDPRFDYILFTDAPVPDTGVFDVRPLPYHSYDSTRSARFVKTHPHMLLPDYDLAIWVDGNILILDDVWPLVEELENSGKPLAAIPHPLRKSIEEELEACLERGKDESEIMKAQVESYLNEGFISNFLIESNLLIFNLRDKRLEEFLSIWWREIDRHSRRDQLSLPYAIEKTGLQWLPLTEPPSSVRDHPSFALVKHNGAAEAATLLDALSAPIRDPMKGETYASVRDKRIRAASERSIDIVVCVHNALDDVRECLQSVEAKRKNDKHRLIIVNDGSDEPTTRFLFEFAAARDWVTLEHSKVARGYTKAANAGLAESSAEFVILLNSDTIVTDDWAEKMADAVFSTTGAGLVGPLSNAASYQSIPDIKGKDGQTAVNELPPGVSPDDLNRHCEQWTVDGPLPRVPLVHGFCYGITRALIDRIGMFDEENFPRGYGEENDYCFRAVDAGFGLVIATHTYVFHAKSKSYGTGRSELTKAGTSALRQIHTRPRIDRATQSFSLNLEINRFRDKARMLYAKNV